jgi:hypothetical protein
LLLEAKKLHPKVADFEAFLGKVHGLKLSRAYDLLRLAGGRTTDEEIRQATKDRVKKHRDKKKRELPPTPPKITAQPAKDSVTSPNVTESVEASAERRKAHDGESHAPRPSDYITKKTGCAIASPASPHPIWTAFLERIAPDPELQAFLQRFVGYSLTGLTGEHKFVFAYGTGANGKSTFTNTGRNQNQEHDRRRQNDRPIHALRFLRFRAAVQAMDCRQS